MSCSVLKRRVKREEVGVWDRAAWWSVEVKRARWLGKVRVANANATSSACKRDSITLGPTPRHPGNPPLCDTSPPVPSRLRVVSAFEVK